MNKVISGYLGLICLVAGVMLPFGWAFGFTWAWVVAKGGWAFLTIWTLGMGMALFRDFLRHP